MSSHGTRISRPLYEALPWIYMAAGVAALVASWFHPSHIHSLLLGIPGLLAVLGGIVVLLRRRDFRQMKANNYLGDDDER
jgi:hypothetical protein